LARKRLLRAHPAAALSPNAIFPLRACSLQGKTFSIQGLRHVEGDAASVIYAKDVRAGHHQQKDLK